MYKYTDLNVPTGFYPFSRMVSKWLDPHLSRIPHITVQRETVQHITVQVLKLSQECRGSATSTLCSSWTCGEGAPFVEERPWLITMGVA